MPTQLPPLTIADLDYGLYDADEHYYEAEDCLTRHLDKEFRREVKWVDIEGRRTMIIGGKLLTVVPNPSYNPVGAPGSLEVYFRSANHTGMELRDMVKMQPIQPEYRSRVHRVAWMDNNSVDFAWLIPSLGLGLEEMLCDDPILTHTIFRAYNRWLEEDWGYDRDGRLQTGPMITLLDPAEAEKELARVIAIGIKFITMRPAPVRDPGRHRSPADRAYDRFWSMCEDANVVVGIHAGDSGYSPFVADWGDDRKYTGMKLSPLAEVMGVHTERPIYDMIAAMVCHGIFDRHPKLRVATLELGSGWVPSLHRRFRIAYGKSPQNFGADPSQAFREHVWVSPFYEDSISDLVDVHGADRILMGSDWPHPEGLASPQQWVSEFGGLTLEQVT